MENGLAQQSKKSAGDTLYEYLLVAHPDRAVNDRVNEEKENFFADYNVETAVRTKPHITIANFAAIEPMEETLIRWIQRICSQQRSFPVTFNNYGGFPPHTIYLRVQDHRPFKRLTDMLKIIDPYVRSNGGQAVRLITHPHLTIARSLPGDIYTKALMAYSQKTFHESFVLSGLVLLKRKHAFDTCSRVNVFSFLPAGKDMFGTLQ